MQTITSYLYTPRITAQILDAGVTRVQERVVYNRTIELYKGTDNPVQVRFFNQDQKKFDVTNYTFVASVMDPQEGYTIFQPTITIDDAALGRATIMFTEAELATLDASRYVVAIEGTLNGQRAPLYADDNYGLNVDLHINDGFLPIGTSAVGVESGDYIIDGGTL